MGSALKVFKEHEMSEKPSYEELERRIHELEKAECERSIAEDRLKKIFDNTQDAILIHDLEGKILDVNDKMCRMYGLTKEEALEVTIEKISSSKMSMEDLLERWQNVLNGEKILFEWEARRPKNGSVFNVEVSIQKISFHDKDIVLANVRDITERKRAEEALRQSQDTFRDLFEKSADAILLIDQSGVFVECNQAAVNLLKMSRGEFMNRPPVIISPEFQPNGRRSDEAAQEMIDQAYARGLHRFDWTCVNSEGVEFIVDVSLMPIIINGQQMLHTTWRDITERKRAEEALEKRLVALTQPLDSSEGFSFEEMFNIAELQRLQDKFAQATRVAAIITRPDGTPITAPSNFCRLCTIIRKTKIGLANCIKSDSVLGRMNRNGPVVQPCLSGGLWDAGAAIYVGERHIANWLIGQVRDEEQDEEKIRAYARTIGAGEDAAAEAFREVPAMSRQQFKQVADALFTLATQLSNIAYQNVQQARFITERKRAEEEQEKLQSQLLQAQKMESVGILAGGVAHDFNNLLQTMRGNIELLAASESLCPKSATRLKTVTKSMDRAAQLVRQLLLFSRKAGSSRVRVDLNQEVANVARMLERTIPKMIALELHLDPSIWQLFADPIQIEQILLNLANNAVDAMPDGGKLTIETSNVEVDEGFVRAHLWLNSGPHVLLTVTDTGHGMDREVLEHVFDPFFTTKEVGKGTGLGLASVYGIAKAHGGYIQCSSEPNQGTTFRVYLPVLSHGDMATAEPPRQAAAQGGNETILVVDDEPEIRELTREALVVLGHSVQTAATGEQALEIFKTEGKAIDLVLLDLNMPGMGGYRCLQELLQIDPSVKVIIASGYSASAHGKDALASGSKGFIGKPYQLKELAAMVQEVLDEKTTEMRPE